MGTEVDAHSAGAAGGVDLASLRGAGGGGGVTIFTGGLTYYCRVSTYSAKTIDIHIPLVVVVNSLLAC